MFEKINTPRISLRLISHKDVTSLHAILNNPLVSKFNDYSTPLSKSDVKQLIQDDISGYYEGEVIRLAITHNTLNKVIGSCGLYKINEQVSCAFLGFEMAPDFWGKGYMKEALVALIPELVMIFKLKTIYAEVDSRNLASCNLLNGLGFQLIESKSSVWFCHF